MSVGYELVGDASKPFDLVQKVDHARALVGVEDQQVPLFAHEQIRMALAILPLLNR